jgi:hypothetical protein
MRGLPIISRLTISASMIVCSLCAIVRHVTPSSCDLIVCCISLRVSGKVQDRWVSMLNYPKTDNTFHRERPIENPTKQGQRKGSKGRHSRVCLSVPRAPTVMPAYMSVSTSTFAVHSSRTRILGLRRSARARHRSCRCPTLKFSPFSATYRIGFE